MQQPATISFGEWTLHRNTGELERGGKRVRIPDQAHHILDALLTEPGELVTRVELWAHYRTPAWWDATFYTERPRTGEGTPSETESRR